ncbi:MAG TPA: glutathione-disulfide reductase [Burkholderiaceae bacterium]|nr:glutathione-disulfide reductase [Burkholderiaceae bacterium]
MQQVDLFVIGGGSAGVRAARVAAQHGARVSLAEADRLGGTCVIRGCVPKKLMVLASRFAQGFDDAAGFGWTLPDVARFDWATLRERVQAEVTRLEGVYRGLLDRAGVALHAERATLADAHTVQLASSGERIRARHILVATGAAPRMPPDIPGAELASSSNELFHWPAQPRRVVVQGAGYIALEFACLLRRLGSEVTVVLRGERVLRGFDDELRAHLQSELAGQGIRFVTGATLQSIAKSGAALRVALSDGSAIEADAVLRALGRAPLTQGLGLEAAGVALDGAGAVIVDIDGRSSVPHIHAVGDVTDRVQLTPAAIREGQAFADRVFGGVDATRLSHLGADAVVPSAVFTTPEVGSAGLTEAEALQRHADIDVFSTMFRPLKAALAGGTERTLMKLVVHRGSGRVLGCHLVGADAAEMIQLVGVVLTLRATKADLDATLAVHPTAAEELVTMRLPTRQHGI